MVETHSVMWSEECPNEIPVGFRSVYVVPYKDSESLCRILKPLRAYLQTATLGFDPEKNIPLLDSLIEVGVYQFFRAGSGLAVDFGFPHEGEFSLRRMVKIIGIANQRSPFGIPV